MRLIPLFSRIGRLFAAVALIAGPAGPAFAGFEPALPPSSAKTARTGALPARQVKLPLYFEANRGQTDAAVKFFTRAGGYSLYLTAAEAVIVLPRAASTAGAEPGVVRMKLKGANASLAVRGRDILPGYSNYILGKDSSGWRSGAEHYARVELGQVYPGIDMVYRFSQGKVEHDFVVAPGANPWRILLGFEGAKSLRLDPRGNLVLRVEGGELTYKAPELYQTLGSRRVPVKGRYVLAANNHVRFEVGNYIRSKELVIAPALAYSSYLGGTANDYSNAIFVDASNNAYLTGKTDAAPFPGTSGKYQAAYGTGAFDAFVTKVNADGTLAWSTLYGAAGNDIGLGIGVDGTGKVYITGSTTGPIPGEATIGGLGGTDAFVAAFSAAGTALVYADRFGGAGEENGKGIAVNAAGSAYVTGFTNSASPDFVTTAGAAQTVIGGGGATDAFVTKFSAAGAQVYSTFLGGTGIDRGNAIAIDSLGNAYITGQTSANLPVTPVAPPSLAAFKLTVTGSNDAFIAKLDPTGANWVYVTYVGGGDQDQGTGIALGGTDIVYITGWTLSGDFPGSSFVPVGQTTKGTAEDAFVFKLHIGNGGLTNDGVYSTYLGASGADTAAAIAVDGAGNAYVTGHTYSGDFPVVGPISGQGTLVGTAEGFVTQLGPTGGTIGFSSYLGGTLSDSAGQGIALDSANNIYVTGWTNSAGFPTASPFQAAISGPYDAFIAKIGTPSPPVACTINSLNPDYGFMVGGTTVTISISNFTGFLSTSTGVTFDGVNARSYAANASSDVITAVSPRHPLSGTLTPGAVPLTITTLSGTCSATYRYAASPVTDTGACGEDFFFPSPATGAKADFAYCMESPGTVKIRVYNAVGDLAAKLEYAKGAGAQNTSLNTGRLAPGVYLYRLEKKYDNGTSSKSSVKKFVVKH